MSPKSIKSKRKKRSGQISEQRILALTTDYRESHYEDLRNFDHAVGYLKVAMEEGEDVFRLAVRDVINANK
jgi:hypothetical protein